MTVDEDFRIVEERIFEIWSAGYWATGMDEPSGPVWHATMPGATFKDAVKAWKELLQEENPDGKKDEAGHVDYELIDLDRMTWWGCPLFDNEVDAERASN